MDDSSEALAVYLADRLNDWESYPFFREVVRTVPKTLVRDALVRSLDVPLRSLRKSRAAYFTALVSRHMRQTSHRNFS